MYRNFWFGVGDNGRLPTILLGRPVPKYNSEDIIMVRAFEVLAKHNPLLSFGPSRNLSTEDQECLFKVVYLNHLSRKKDSNFPYSSPLMNSKLVGTLRRLTVEVK
jgi:hypothetical protein